MNPHPAAHQDHLHFVFVKAEHERDREHDKEGEKPHQHRQLRRSKPHQIFVGDEL
jgi:hypothetical protein